MRILFALIFALFLSLIASAGMNISPGTGIHTHSDANTGGTTLGWIVSKRKTADESVVSSTVLQDDDHLTFAIGANEEWMGTCHLSVGSNPTVTGFRFTFTAPAGNAMLFSEAAAGNTLGKARGQSTTSSGNILIHTPTDVFGINLTVDINFWVLNAGTAGNVTLRWAQDASSVTAVTVRKGSNCRATRVL